MKLFQSLTDSPFLFECSAMLKGIFMYIMSKTLNNITTNNSKLSSSTVSPFDLTLGPGYRVEIVALSHCTRKKHHC